MYLDLRGVNLSNQQGYYFNFPVDLSGSISKNRFRFELLWGLKKVIELQLEDIKFSIIFDYFCDIEIHKKDSFEFYQIKSTNSNGSFTVDKLINRNKSNESILGKVFKLKLDSNNHQKDSTLVNVVCNAPLAEKNKIDNKTKTKTYNSVEIVALKETLSATKIQSELKKELNFSKEIDLNNTFYIRTSLDLINPNYTLIGELTDFFKKKYNSEPSRIYSLFKLIEGEINAKACYELEISDYENVLLKKGINSSFFSEIFNTYIVNDEEFLKKCIAWTEKEYENSFIKRNKYKTALSQIRVQLETNKFILNKQQEIKELIIRNSAELPNTDKEIIGYIYDEIKHTFPIETSVEEIEMLILVVIKKFDEGIFIL